MNRNIMYNILKETDLTSRFIYYKHKKGYYTIFRHEDRSEFNVDLGVCFVKGVCEIALCTNEIVLMSKYENMKMNIDYKNITQVNIKNRF